MFTRFPIRNPQVLAKWENALNKYDHKEKTGKLPNTVEFAASTF